MKLDKFYDKHVYLVGGSSGIGLAIAKKLVMAGAHILLISRTQATLQEATQALELLRNNSQQKIRYQ